MHREVARALARERRARRPGALTNTPSPGEITATVPSRASRIDGVHSQQARLTNDTVRRRDEVDDPNVRVGPPSLSLCS